MKFFHINAFTNEPFKGNPAMVVILEKELADSTLQLIAKEVNLPITTYLQNKDDKWGIRWFTPKQEIDLCGHGTVAAAHVVLKEGESVDFYHPSKKVIQVTKENSAYNLTFNAIGIKEVSPNNLFGQIFKVPIVNVVKSGDIFIVELEREADVKGIEPDFSLIENLPCRGVAVTSLSSEYDFISRYFAPKIGIREDQVTGSLHCALAPYWANKLNKNCFKAFQASERGGKIDLLYIGDKVHIKAEAITIGEGQWFI